MAKDQHTIYGIKGCAAVLESRKYKITDVLIQSGGAAERGGQITPVLRYLDVHIKILPASQFISNFNQWRTQRLIVRFFYR